MVDRDRLAQAQAHVVAPAAVGGVEQFALQLRGLPVSVQHDGRVVHTADEIDARGPVREDQGGAQDDGCHKEIDAAASPEFVQFFSQSLCAHKHTS